MTESAPELNPRFKGNDNYGRPRANYLKQIAEMDLEKLSSETYQMIYHSARCNNNPRADWHWMVDACYEECKRRDPDLYNRIYQRCVRENT